MGAKAKRKYKKPGQPTRFGPKIKKHIQKLTLKGFTDNEISEILGIHRSTYYNWRKTHKKFFDSVKEWKIVADEKVERALYDRACGYTCPDTKPQWVNDDNGGHWEYAEIEKHYPPDPTSMIFWLKNRQPAAWRDKQDINHAGNVIFRAPDIKKDE